MKETLQDLLNMPLKKGDVEEIKNLAEAKGRNITVEQAMCLAMIKKALKGDISAATFVRDTSRNKEAENMVANVFEDMKKAFIENDD